MARKSEHTRSPQTVLIEARVHKPPFASENPSKPQRSRTDPLVPFFNISMSRTGQHLRFGHNSHHSQTPVVRSSYQSSCCLCVPSFVGRMCKCTVGGFGRYHLPSSLLSLLRFRLSASIRSSIFIFIFIFIISVFWEHEPFPHLVFPSAFPRCFLLLLGHRPRQPPLLPERYGFTSCL